MIITFTGDTSITGSFVDKINKNVEIFSDSIRTTLDNSDYVIANLEGPTTNHEKYINNGTPLKSPINTISYLKKRNISVFNLANNHILDYGEKGIKDTLEILKNNNCLYFGADLSFKKAIQPLILKNNNVSVGLIGITKTAPSTIKDAQVFSSEDFKTLKREIYTLKQQVDLVIVNFHGGEEYTLFPSPVKRHFLKKVAKLNTVDCVIAHHSHTLQGYEICKQTPIFYSLGNFIFDIPNHKKHKNTDRSALLHLKCSKKGVDFSFTSYTIAEGEVLDYDSKSFDNTLKELSDFKNYMNKWQKEAYKVLFRKQNDKTIPESNGKSLQQQSFLRLFFTKEFYLKTWMILSDRYMFSLYTNAIIYKLKKKLS